MWEVLCDVGVLCAVGGIVYCGGYCMLWWVLHLWVCRGWILCTVGVELLP